MEIWKEAKMAWDGKMERSYNDLGWEGWKEATMREHARAKKDHATFLCGVGN